MPRPWWLLSLCAVAGAVACAGPVRTRRLPASVFHAARLESSGARALPAPGGLDQGAWMRSRRARAALPPDPIAGGSEPSEGSEFVERTLHGAGLHFGTDGSTRALWGYMRTSHELVPASEARPGDVVFFDVWGTGRAPACADHAGIVESVDADRRIGFLERRGGRVLHSFVDPERPAVRRDEQGRVLNSFLRPIRIAEPPGARHFAGEMICGVFRVTHR